MRLQTLVLFLMMAFSVVFHAAADEHELRIMTFNIRFGTAQDGENSWPHRRDMVLDRIRDYQPDVIGLQEALRMQLDSITSALPQYVVLGTGREADGGGEYSPILYRRNRFDVANAETFWLSDTPQKPGSMSWGNGLPRVCTWARLLDHRTGQRWSVFNTHWDHRSQPAREQSGQAIADRVVNLVEHEPVIVMGDFNAGESNPAVEPLRQAGLRDSFRVRYPDAKKVGTFNGFKDLTDGEKIDGIFVSEHWNVEAAAIDRTSQDGRSPSDHFPVTATLQLK